ncbi:uncharacterized protein LOC115627357 [Scaptodrosophila lebanonensis]|uniref:Uncharacterized protein LOC115627357 n=1 Tax=Drosophila lebanonensis TaxID=7225 RepID=A0A6J2TQC1_DROLE|nr:uncharacterized protein LOC115627357 [Scaptodrosophila lebanonensis]
MYRFWHGGISTEHAQLILDWINSLLHTKYTSLAQLRNGDIWSQLMEAVGQDVSKLELPNLANNRGDFDELQALANFKVLKSSLRTVAINRDQRVKDLINESYEDIVQISNFFDELHGKQCVHQRQAMLCGSGKCEGQCSQQAGELKPSEVLQMAQEMGLLDILGRKMKEKVQPSFIVPPSEPQPYLKQPMRNKKVVAPPDLSDHPSPPELPKLVTPQNVHLFFETLPAAIAEPLWRKQELKASRKKVKAKSAKQSQDDLMTAVSKALRWSPTNRRNYVLPKRATRLRQSRESSRRPPGDSTKRHAQPQRQLTREEQLQEAEKEQRREYIARRQQEHQQLELMVHACIQLKQGQRLMERLWREHKARKRQEREKRRLENLSAIGRSRP